MEVVQRPGADGLANQAQLYARRLVALEPWQEQAHIQLMIALAQCGQRSAALEQYAAFSRALHETFGMKPSPQVRTVYERIRLEDGRFPPRQRASAPPTVVAATAPHSERRQVTALVCGRRNPAGADDPEEQIEQWARCREQCGPILERYGGQRQTRQGMECLVYFGYPQAQEDAALRAVQAALELASHNHLDEMRIGIHTGLMITDDGALVGNVPDLARACHHLAGPDQVTLTASVERLARGRFAYQLIGQIALPGETETPAVYRVAGESGVQSRLEWLAQQQRLTSFVGREAEAAQLVNWLAAPSGQQCPVIVLRGEPGIGKSRLARELRRQGRYDLWLESHCTPYLQNTSLFPLTRLLEQLLGFQPDDTPQGKVDKLDRLLARLEMDQSRHSRLLSLMLELPTAPQTMVDGLRQRMRESFLTLLTRFAATQTAVFLIEDLQWADPSTLAWLDAAIETLAETGCRLLLTHRASFTLPWRPRPQLRHLALSPLTPEQAMQMVDNLAGGMAAADAGRIVALTDGNPLFVEELTWTLLETGPQLRRDAIPPTLRDLLLARLDRVGAAKETAGWAAALGREFTYGVLTAVVPYDKQRLQSDLAALQAADLICPAAGSAQPAYAFRHVLVQEAAYTSLLKRARQTYHQRIAETLAERFPEIAETRPELLAEHYANAGAPSQAAANFWLRAGERSMAQGATLEASRFFDRAVDLIGPEGSKRLWPALWGRETALFLRGEREAQKADIAALLELAETLDNDTRRAQAQTRRARYASSQADYHEQLEAAEAAVAAARRAGDLTVEAEALAHQVTALLRLGERAAVHQAVERTLAQAQKVEDDTIRAYAMAAVALYYVEVGDLARAARFMNQSLEAAGRARVRQLDLETQYHGHLGFIYTQLGLYALARQTLEAGLELANLMGTGRLIAYHKMTLGFVNWRIGDLQAAVQMEEEALRDYSATGELFGVAACQAYLGYIYRDMGDLARAAAYLAQARAGFAGLGVAADKFEAQAVEASVWLALGRPEEARQLAIEVWHYLGENGVEGLGSPAWVFVSIADVLGGAPGSDSAARQVIEIGYRELVRSAEKISDAAWRRSFLENVVENKSIVERWENLTA